MEAYFPIAANTPLFCYSAIDAVGLHVKNEIWLSFLLYLQPELLQIIILPITSIQLATYIQLSSRPNFW